MTNSEPNSNDAFPGSNFEMDGALAPWNMPAKAWLTKHDKHWNGLCSGIVVFDPEDRVLIIQRASHDSMPDKWEVPGGGIDDEDATILHGAARELWEEAGLVAKGFQYVVTEGDDIAPSQVFTNRTGTKFFRRIAFVADVENCDQVKLDPDEHQAFMWASEDEIRTGKVGDCSFTITHESMRALILEAFRLKRVWETSNRV
ncbi:NUDIX hydrolase domain-like protein [Xylariaceae sp. FL1651]|nr:NUDIX hydrolase domain-like protein [Xylariaceae sp. FL1651]